MSWSPEQWQHAVRMRRIHVRVLPRVGEPITIYRDYFTMLMRVREDMIAAVRKLVVPHLEELAADASRVATTDELSLDGLGDWLDRARMRFEAAWPRARMIKVLDTIAKDVASFAARNLNKVLSAALGQVAPLSVVGNEGWLNKAIAEFTAENVALIRTIPSVFFADLERLITRAMADGQSWEELAQIIEDRYAVSARRAAIIARDQINKFVGDLNRVRQTDLGITEFVWQTMGDERVRSDMTEGPGFGHRERNGRTYKWTSPPEGETPGEPINCRCWAVPVLPEID